MSGGAMQDYEFLGTLGEGICGVVYKCRHKKTGETVAVKCYKGAHSDKRLLSLAAREVRSLRAAAHPNVVALRDALTDAAGHMHLVMDYVPHSLARYLELNPRGLPAAQVRLVMWQLLAATAAAHARGVIHRDINPTNILLEGDGTVKLADFGLARSVDVPGVRSASAAYTAYVTTRWYRAPEVLVGAAYGPPADVWALGCVLAELATGRPLLPGHDTLDQLCLTMQLVGKLPEAQARALRADKSLAAFAVPPPSQMSALDTSRFSACSAHLMQAVRACLDANPDTRLCALEVLCLPYFDNVHEELRGTALQDAYDAAYARAHRNGDTAVLPALRATCSGSGSGGSAVVGGGGGAAPALARAGATAAAAAAASAPGAPSTPELLDGGGAAGALPPSPPRSPAATSRDTFGSPAAVLQHVHSQPMTIPGGACAGAHPHVHGKLPHASLEGTDGTSAPVPLFSSLPSGRPVGLSPPCSGSAYEVRFGSEGHGLLSGSYAPH